ncbi:hypothetical protein [Rhodoferax sp.]|uniref:hypothetical protein n=1 Tax=Rhodoferax sp. TaxID=50421 RepID=UPI002844624B|nr:hypothetical protein [Rhodoferax sp.]MDR3370470.1 hypothetical protein [Rhodoferax sp.]
MKEDQPLAAGEPKRKSNQHTLLWILVGSFVVASIGAMLAIDYFYAGDPATAVNAVDD